METVLIMRTLGYFDKPISKVTNSELINWLIAFLNGTSWNEEDGKLYEEFMAEVPNRSAKFQAKVKYLKSVI